MKHIKRMEDLHEIVDTLRKESLSEINNSYRMVTQKILEARFSKRKQRKMVKDLENLEDNRRQLTGNQNRLLGDGEKREFDVYEEGQHLHEYGRIQKEDQHFEGSWPGGEKKERESDHDNHEPI